MRPIFLVHIPKTAGTSLRQMLAKASPRPRCFPSRWRLWLNGGRYPPLAAYEQAAGSRRYDLIAGHLPVAAGRHLGRADCWVMLRDPIERAISNLRHIQRTMPRYRDVDLEALATRRPVIANHLWNLQCRFLQDHDPARLRAFRRGARPPEIDLDSALSNLRRCAFVGVTERFEKSVRLAERTAGIRLPPVRHDNTDQERPRYRSSDGLRQHLAAMNEFDQVLYEAALDLFENRYRKVIRDTGTAAS